MKKFRNAYDYDPALNAGEINDLPSQTVPDMTLSLSQLIERYTRGGEVAKFNGSYQDTDDFDDRPDISKMDTMARLQYAQEIRQSIAEYQTYQAEAKLKAEAEKQAAEQAATPAEPPKEEPQTQ